MRCYGMLKIIMGSSKSSVRPKFFMNFLKKNEVEEVFKKKKTSIKFITFFFTK